MTVPRKPSPLSIFLVFFNIGTFTIGGGYAMVPLIRREVTERKNWLDDTEFLDLIALSQSGPGAIAINTAVLVGHRLAGIPGAVVATLGAILPSLITILLIAAVFTNVARNPYVEAAFRGARPAVVAMIASAAYTLGRRVITDFRTMALGTAAFVALLLGVPPILVVVSAAVVGVIFGA
ncbi:MAG TPA: chromate transporter [Clostridia bacterium]|nr:chromate transporter [Clostridia bacterium]